jgi:hypothetical protein
MVMGKIKKRRKVIGSFGLFRQKWVRLPMANADAPIRVPIL